MQFITLDGNGLQQLVIVNSVTDVPQLAVGTNFFPETDRSGSIIATGVPQLLLPPNPLRSGWMLQNQDSENDQFIYEIGGALFLGSIDGAVLIVVSLIYPNNPVQLGSLLGGGGVSPGTTILSYGSGNGGVGTYNLSASQGDIAQTELMTILPAPWAIYPQSTVACPPFPLTVGPLFLSGTIGATFTAREW